ncbi:MAG: hypothetical protein H6Q97_437, partial [Nitrospirae bacterium]|nr:hypothetical protein [Nitrospirota bacterium]
EMRILVMVAHTVSKLFVRPNTYPAMSTYSDYILRTSWEMSWTIFMSTLNPAFG